MSLNQTTNDTDDATVLVSTSSVESSVNKSANNDDDDSSANSSMEQEWDGKSPFWIHCTAGSIAGVIEHGALYPLDTVRTHIQVCATWVQRSAASNAAAAATGKVPPVTPQTSGLPLGMLQTIRYLVSEAPPSLSSSSPSIGGTGSSAVESTIMKPQQGWVRLWRGVQTVVFGCAPSHAVYFASYELIKGISMDDYGHVPTWGSSLAGATATFGHDFVMTPMDTIKQRLQLGHYNGGIMEAFRAITSQEGYYALYRSFPITLATKIPYHMIMVTVNERCKEFWTPHTTNTPHYQRQANLSTVLAAGSMAGFVASALTTPLDRIKTTLQTQKLAPNCTRGAAAAVDYSTAGGILISPNWRHAATMIYQNEGLLGFFRGMTPRVLSHTPAVAISWTAYETVKRKIVSTMYT